MLYSNNTLIGDKRFSELSNEELKRIADRNAKDINELTNQAKQKVQSEPVTKTEEKVTEPVTKTKQPTTKAEDLKLNVKSTTNGLVDISNQENEIEDFKVYPNPSEGKRR